MLDVLRRFFVRVEPRTPPRGVETINSLGEIGEIFDLNAARQAARSYTDQRNMRRRPPADAWLRD